VPRDVKLIQALDGREGTISDLLLASGVLTKGDSITIRATVQVQPEGGQPAIDKSYLWKGFVISVASDSRSAIFRVICITGSDPKSTSVEAETEKRRANWIGAGDLIDLEVTISGDATTGLPGILDPP
jgi:hypothetical protein